jgi:hypothetical protein
MNRQRWLLLTVTLVLIAGAGVLLNQLRTHQSLGLPGVKTSPIAGSIRLQVDLPAKVMDYDSKAFEVDEVFCPRTPALDAGGTWRRTGPG